MKNITLFFTLLAFIAFSSCGKDSGFLDKKDYDKTEKEACLDLVYPVTYTMPDGSEITGNTEDEVWTAIKNWYEVNPDSEEKPSLNYPVDIIFKDGTTENIADEIEMILAKENCEDEDDLELCEWDEATEASGPEFEKYIVKELVISEDCECIVSGMEKYLENGQTRFLIYYKYEGCVGYGYKVTCINGDCEKDVEKCKFLQDCDGN